MTGSNCLKGVSGKMIVDKKGIKDSWKKYMEKLMNKENELDHRISAGVKEGPADCIRMDDVAAALKKMETQSTRFVRPSSRNDTIHRGHWNSMDIGFISWYCDRRLHLPEDWMYSVVLPVYKGRGMQWSVDLTEE